ncbi:MAG: helix-turn-helix transcriptional regulator [Ruminococcus sp.]|nr:helix-turn-helix transcriptional regulator [Ruminococcus sp.]
MYNPQITVDRIKELRTMKGISLAELNEACGLNKNTITVSANSKTGLSAKILSDVSKFLGCSVDYLLGETDNGSNINFQNTERLNDISQRDIELLQKINSLTLDDYAEIINSINEKLKRVS